jgi:hypothetical protein
MLKKAAIYLAPRKVEVRFARFALSQNAFSIQVLFVNTVVWL